MKAIIIAAGKANRLMPITDHQPKCLLDVGGMTIIQRQLRVLKDCGICDISIVVDTDWLSHYKGRDQHPVTEAELVAVEGNRVSRIGKDVVLPDEAYGEFIGLAKFSQRGAGILRAVFHAVVDESSDGGFQQAASVEKAYLTDMLQELIDQGHVVNSIDIRGGWQEIDTPQDLERARRHYG